MWKRSVFGGLVCAAALMAAERATPVREGYVRTPFGVVKKAQAPGAPAKGAPGAAIRVVSDGEVVKFERPSPFGPMRWERKKSELTGEERAAVEKSAAESSSRMPVRE